MKKREFFINTLILTMAFLIMRIINIGFRAYLSQKLGAEGIGLYQLIFSVFTPAVAFAASGISLTVTRLVTKASAENNPGQIPSCVAKCAALSLIMSLSTSAVLLSISDFLAKTFLFDIHAAPALRILVPSLPFMALSACMKGYFLAQRCMLRSAESEIFEQVMTIAVTVGLFLYASPATLNDACFSVMLGSTLGEIISCLNVFIMYRIHLRRFKKLPQEKCPNVRRSFTHITLPGTFSTAARSFLSAAENLLIPSGLKKHGADSAAAMAQYGMLEGMVLPILFFPSSFLSAFASLLIPEMSEALATGKKKSISSATSRALQMTFLFSIFITVMFMIFPHELGMAFYKSPEAGGYLRILAPLVPFLYLDTVADGLLKGLDQQVRSFAYNTADAALRVFLIIFALPAYGLKGYLYVFAFCTTMNVFLSIHRLLTVADVKIYFSSWILKPVLCSCAALISFKFLPIPISGRFLPLILRLAASGTFYFIFLCISKSLSKADRKWIRSIFHSE